MSTKNSVSAKHKQTRRKHKRHIQLTKAKELIISRTVPQQILKVLLLQAKIEERNAIPYEEMESTSKANYSDK